MMNEYMLGMRKVSSIYFALFSALIKEGVRNLF